MDPSHNIQLAAYKELIVQHFKENNIPLSSMECGTLYIAADGSPKLVPVIPSEERKNFGIFMGALGVHYWKLSNGRAGR